MKKTFTILSILLFGTLLSNAQEFYLKGGLGYALPHGTQPYDAFGNAYSGSVTNSYNGATGTTRVFNVKKPSLTAGVNGTIGVGIMVSKHIGVELAANIGLANRKYELKYDDNDGTKHTRATIVQQAKNPTLVVPALLLQSAGEKINVYMRMGIVVPIQTTYTLESTSTTVNLLAIPNSNDQIIYKEQFKTRFGVGFSGAVGAKYKVAKIVSVFAELSFTSLSLYAKQSEVTEYIVNGVNYTNSLSTSAKTSKYEFEATTTSNSANTYNTFAIPYSNVGFTAGVFLSVL